MPRRSYTGFPEIFSQLTSFAVSQFFRATPEGPALMEVTCKSKGMAINTAMQLRQYWNALILADGRGEFPEYDPRALWVRHVPMLACRAKKDAPHIVEVLHRSQLASARYMADALESMEAVRAAIKASGGTPAPLAPPLGKEEKGRKLPSISLEEDGVVEQEDLLQQRFGSTAPTTEKEKGE